MKFKFTPPSKPLEPGTYQATVIDAEDAVSSNGSDQVILELRFPGGMKIKDRLTSSEKAYWRVTQAWVAFGFDAAKDGEEIDCEAEDFIGREATVRIDLGEERNGKRYLEVAEYVAPIPI